MADQIIDPVIAESGGRLSPAILLEKLNQRTQKRCILLRDIFNEQFSDWSGIKLNKYKLRETVESYYCDVYRVKFFRPIDHIDRHKQAAYTMKWIAKIQPVSTTDCGAELKSSSLMANAYFAIKAGLALLEFDLEKFPQSDEQWATYYQNLAYLLHYHDVDADFLSSELFVLNEWTQNKGA